MFRYPTNFVYKVSVYYLDPLNFWYFFLLILISALLRDLQKMAASKPISWLFLKKTSLISLNNNFGTLNFCLGLFPFRHTTLSYYVRLLNIYLCPSECKYSPIKSLQSPDVNKILNLILFEITVLYLLRYIIELPTNIGFAENQLYQSVLSFTYLPQFLGYLYNDNPFGLL